MLKKYRVTESLLRPQFLTPYNYHLMGTRQRNPLSSLSVVVVLFLHVMHLQKVDVSLELRQGLIECCSSDFFRQPSDSIPNECGALKTALPFIGQHVFFLYLTGRMKLGRHGASFRNCCVADRNAETMLRSHGGTVPSSIVMISPPRWRHMNLGQSLELNLA